jgi:hypothetical protein
MEIRTIVHQFSYRDPLEAEYRQLIEGRERVRQAEAAASKRFPIATRKRIRRNEDASAGRHLLDARGGVRGVQRQGCNHQSQVVESGRDAPVAGLGEKRAVAGTSLVPVQQQKDLGRPNRN